MSRRLLIFLKHPAPGRVKTRLAQAVGPQAAAHIYRACTELTLRRLARFRRDAILCIDPPEALDAVRKWVGRGWTLLPQRGATLGERLTHATQQAFRLEARRVVVIGTDSPWLTPDDIHAAFAVLQRSDVVVGPAEDGGYYLIGLSQDAPELFTGIPWSTPHVFQRTQARARTLGLRLVRLPSGYDLDYVENVQRFITEERQRRNVPIVVRQMEVLRRVELPPPVSLRETKRRGSIRPATYVR